MNTYPVLALIGYGRMGKEIESAAFSHGHAIPVIIDSADPGRHFAIDESTLAGIDVCIEFTTPDSVLENIRACASCGKNIVVGTTGWQQHIGTVRDIVAKNDIGLIHASNYSIGVHVFRRVVRAAAQLMRHYEQYDVGVQEIHHAGKKDAPSGTAYMIAAEILEGLHRKTRISIDRPKYTPAPEELIISSSRIGAVPGEHTVLFDSEADSIELRHTARGRRGFADGALMAASWINGRKGLYTLEEMFDDLESI